MSSRRRRRPVCWMADVPRDVVIPTLAAQEVAYNKQVSAVVREMRRNPDFARRWAEANEEERVVLLTAVAMPALRGGISPASARDLCFVCRTPSAEDDLVIVVDERVYYVCEPCADAARTKVNGPTEETS